MSKENDVTKLDSSPFPDDLGEELAVQPAKGFSKLTLGLAAGVVLVAGVLIGIQAGKAFGSSSGTPAAAQQGRTNGQLPGGYGRQGGYGQQPGSGQNGGFGQRMGGGTVGTVEKVDGDKVYVKTMDGATVTVTTSDRTTVQISKPGKVADLAAGTTVVVRGQQAGDGSVTATTITQGSQGGGPR
ncbi:MAG: hypothetical protein HOV96_06005 [Nonomuraea sp.]|nr:hypothetical protein [Nonomuraea sp.]NUP60671.1 hypothetical protein [Nonomuraea sp.]NUP77087.1 hypothetical protein [Nonomuraea sp.]NUS07680.1 hypothetical protein [Nonomuraea sp.]NUT12306.1 hypothetical protein [Nonomuraea sp.]